MAPGLSACLTYFAIRFLRRPLVADIRKVRPQALWVNDAEPAGQALAVDPGVDLAQREGVPQHEAAPNCVLGHACLDQRGLRGLELRHLAPGVGAARAGEEH